MSLTRLNKPAFRIWQQSFHLCTQVRNKASCNVLQRNKKWKIELLKLEKFSFSNSQTKKVGVKCFHNQKRFQQKWRDNVEKNKHRSKVELESLRSNLRNLAKRTANLIWKSFFPSRQQKWAVKSQKNQALLRFFSVSDFIFWKKKDIIMCLQIAMWR